MLSNLVIAHDKYYNMELEYNNGNIKYINSNISIERISVNSGDYIADIISFDNKLLNRTSFSVQNVIFYDNIDNKTGEIVSGGSFLLNKTNFTIYLPYYENAKEIKISKLNITTNRYDKILTIDVSYYAREIPKDYKVAKENLTIKKETKEVEETSGQNAIIYGFAGIILLLIVIVLYLIKRRND